MRLPPSFYTRNNVVKIARELLGKVIVTNIDGIRTAGMIVETEAYAGIEDKAAHSFGGRLTERTKVMFMEGGVAYIYLCYGIHHLFNVITGAEGTPTGVLIRAIEPLEGIEDMLLRRKKDNLTSALTAGPGAMSAALGIHTALTGTHLQGENLYIEDRGIKIKTDEIVTTTRIGVAYAGDDALLPYRFYIKGNKFVSKGKGL